MKTEVLKNIGEVQEWLNWHAWKACVPQKGTGGSNPPLSARESSLIKQIGLYHN